MKIKPLAIMSTPRLVFRLVFGLLLVSLVSACGQAEFTDAEGNDFDWRDYNGQWLVVNYWAEWCKPCREEIPELNQLHQEPGKSVLGVNFDRPELAELQRQIDVLSVGFPVVQIERQQRLKELTPQVLPTTYVFDQQGRLVKKLIGPQTRHSIEAVFSQEPEHNKQ